MKIGILSFRSTSRELTVEEDRLVEAAKQLGHEALVVHAMDYGLKLGNSATEILWQGEAFPHVDVLIPRARFIDQPELRLTVLFELEKKGVPILNSPAAIAAAKNKITSLLRFEAAGLAVPRTMVIEDVAVLEHVLESLTFPLVVKPPYGTYGQGIVLVESERALRSHLDFIWAQEGIAPLLIQEFIKEADGKDTRIFVVGGKVKAAMQRCAQPGEFRSNIELGGISKVVEISDSFSSLALSAVKALGLDFAGVDIVSSERGPLLLEVNANPGFKALESVTGKNIAESIIELAEQRAAV